MLFASATDTTVQVTIITSGGLIVIALIGVWTAKITTGAQKKAKTSADDASKSADIARDFAAALQAKDSLIDSLKAEVDFLKQEVADLKQREARREQNKSE